MGKALKAENENILEQLNKKMSEQKAQFDINQDQLRKEVKKQIEDVKKKVIKSIKAQKPAKEITKRIGEYFIG